MSTFAEMQAAVDCGARFCDIVRPGWVDEIDLELFDFSSSADCIAGQLFDYHDLLRNQGFKFLQRNGFTGPDGFAGWYMDAQKTCSEECPCTPSEFNVYDVMHEMWTYKIRKAKGL